ncbi:MAG: hypothetical protein UV39_C0025G0007 [Candidatus Azambacteria bacterium GW2011_GWA2_42_62]|nr:MAG: hypothetical protein UV39_C0025G0007 [Candidatus Azambacteria bacterium GW2011_GWA2_42_62]
MGLAHVPPREPPGESPPSKSTCKVPAPVAQVRPLAQLRVANTGSAPVEPTRSCPLVPTVKAVMASVPEPTRTPWSRRVEAPVPPSDTVRSVMPVMVPPVMETLEEVRLVTVPVVPQNVGRVA